MLVRWHQSKKERKGKTIQLYIMWKTLWRPCWLRYCLNSVWGSRTMKRFPITCPTGLVRTRVFRLLAGRQPNNIEVPSFLSLWRLAEGESNKRKLTRKRGGFLFSPPFYSIRQKQNIFLSFVEKKKNCSRMNSEREKWRASFQLWNLHSTDALMSAKNIPHGHDTWC